MNNNNNNNKRGKAKGNAAQLKKALKNEILNEIRAAAGQPAKGKGRGKRNRQAKRAGAQGQSSVAAAYATGQQTGQAQIFRNGVESCRIIHRELIASITGSVAFTVASAFALNPGLAATFPWLSNEAAGWERYHFNKLRFCYYTRTGSNVPGSFMMAPDYDASDAAPVSEQVASSYEDTEEDAPWKDICCDLPSRELHGEMKEKYVRQGALSANQDIKLYDAGNLFACTVDGTAVSWGKLWVEYDVTLFTPQVPSGGFQAVGTLAGNSTTAGSGAPWGSAGLATATGNILLTYVTNVLTIGNVMVGQEIQVTHAAQGTSISAIALGTLVGLTLKTAQFSGFPAAATSGAVIATYTVTAVNPTLTATATAATFVAQTTVAVLAPQPVF